MFIVNIEEFNVFDFYLVYDKKALQRLAIPKATHYSTRNFNIHWEILSTCYIY